MGINRDKPDRWKQDIRLSVDLYNTWFMRFAPSAFRAERLKATKKVEAALRWTSLLRQLTPEVLREHPEILPTLRMACCPPIARDRLIGLSGVSAGIVARMEEGKLPVKIGAVGLQAELVKITKVIRRMADRDICSWLDTARRPTESDARRAATVIADRLCGASADPIIRNSQETRQLKVIGSWLKRHGYRCLAAGERVNFLGMPAGTYAFRIGVPVQLKGMAKPISVSVDVVVKAKKSRNADIPIFVEAKSAGDFTNVNKRRKGEAAKMSQLRQRFGNNVKYVLFICGYFDSGYLGYEASEGIDWVWEHRPEDFVELGL